MNFRTGLVVVALLSMGAGVVTAAPWSKAASKKAADSKNAYPLTEDNGPWMILAATFTGDGAEQQAHELVQELRTKYKMPAYSYHKQFDFSKTVQGRGIDRYGGPQAMRYVRDEQLLEIAVMVGDYAAVTDPDAQKLLKRIKYMHPTALDEQKKESTSQSLASLRKNIRAVLPADSAERQKGPMGSAFITTNPLLPKEYFVPKGIDKLVVDMNKGVKYSLLDCPGRYTVKVATFTGQVVLNQEAIKKIEAGSKMKSRLAEAAEKAHKMAESLRGKGVEAYEFHDRYQSIVTVGSFNSVGTRGADGKIELNPAVHSVMKQYGAETKISGQNGPQVGKPKAEGTVPFDVSPVPVEVPKRSIASDYSRTADGR